MTAYLSPWVYAPNLSASENHRGFRIIDSNHYWVADVSPRDEDGVQGERLARLIAAAPDLLDELRACEKHLHEFVEAIEYGGGAASKSAYRLAQIRAAIAKATGETT